MLNRLLKQTDLLVAVALVSIVVMMVVPLPTPVIDLLIAFNISAAVVVLMLAVFNKEPLEFSVFPSLLLVITLFRLALSVSTTRLILLNANAGDIIRKFGEFVIQGNAVVGFIIFIILVIVQFLVITKGAERVSEVTARFTLDAMPGKQMSIDADLNAGIISDEEARTRRKNIQREADFYGAMDGASKFIKGDAIAGILIVVINIVAGLAIGMTMKGMDAMTALQTYTILTVGDGLVTQIPALLISTSTGLVVTRAANDTNLGQDIVAQFFQAPKAMYVTAGVMIALGLLGMPIIPMFGLAAVFIFIGRRLAKASVDQGVQETEAALEQEVEETKKPENVMGVLAVDNMELEIGYALISLVDTGQGGDLLERIILIRRQIASEMGFVVPIIRVRDNMNLQPNQYVIKIRGAELASGELHAEQYLCMTGGFEDEELPGIPTKEPAFGLDAKWINASLREQAEMSGHTVVDAPTVLATHLTEIIKSQAHDLLSRQDVKVLIDHAREQSPTVVDELVPELLTIGNVQKVLSNLLKERVSIKNLPAILESLADHAVATKDLDRLTEHARQALARQIVQPLLDEKRMLSVLTLEPRIEQMILDNIKPSEYGSFVNLDPIVAQRLITEVAADVEKVAMNGYNPVILCAPLVRINLKRMTERHLPHLTVLSYNELVQGIEVQALGMVVLEQNAS
ncbi:MAG: flagellar biosynthesis protein FlhA [Peptococcaceae bacterium]|nr:flagellar biosynthesis protein FlhA [Peptococcaceae bacterium]